MTVIKKIVIKKIVIFEKDCYKKDCDNLKGLQKKKYVSNKMNSVVM